LLYSSYFVVVFIDEILFFAFVCLFSQGCLVVEVVVTSSGNIVTFLPYYEGAMPFQIINDTDYSLVFHQSEQ